MADNAHKLTDEKLEQMERHLSAIYSRAGKEVQATADAYFAKFKAMDEKKRKLVEAGKLDPEEYKRWRTNKILYGERYRHLKDQIAKELLNVNRTALDYINDQMPLVYSVNYNALAEAVDGVGGYSFTLVDPAVVKKLATEDETLLPYKYVDGERDVRWNTKKVNAEVLQGILQGDSIPKIAGRLQRVTEMNKVSAVRNARTAITSAECKGRQDSYVQAQKDGIRLQREWIATLDGRTRHSHRLLDGQTADVDQPFEVEGEKIMYPGDPTASPHLVYNCRCTTIAKIIGFGKKAAEKATEKAAEAVKKFIPAKTVEEAKEFARTFAENVDFGKMTLKACNSVNEALYSLTQKYNVKLPNIGVYSRGNGVAHASFRGIEFKPSSIGKPKSFVSDYDSIKKINQNTIDSIRETLRTRNVGKKFAEGLENQIKSLEIKNKYIRWGVVDSHADEAVRAVTTHEFGHFLADVYCGQINGEKAWKDSGVKSYWSIAKPMQDKIENAYKNAVESGDIYNISAYGATNSHEFFAEAFAMRELGEKLPDYIEEMFKAVFSL